MLSQKALVIVENRNDVSPSLNKIIKRAKEEKWAIIKPDTEKDIAGMEKTLDEKKVEEVFFCGQINDDYLEKLVKSGFRVVVLKDASPDLTAEQEKELLTKGIIITTVEKIIE